MGFKDRLIEKAKRNAPDYPAVLSEALGPDDSYLGHTLAMPSAYKRRSTRSMSAGGALTNLAINSVTNAVKQSRHLGGEEGSIALSLPLDRSDTLVISARGLSYWDFGVYGTNLPPVRSISIPREQVASFVDTGKTATGGLPIARLTFRDGSFIDYQIYSMRDPAFWQAAASFGTA